jgi:hypothetical protein
MASGRPPGVTGRRQPRPSVRVVPSGCRAHSTRSPPANGTACGVAWPRTTAANPFADDGLRTRAPRGRPARGRIPGRSTPGGIRPSPTAPPTRPRPGTPLSTGTSAASTASAAAEPFVGRTGGTAEEQGGRHAQDVEVELGWGLRIDTHRCGRCVAARSRSREPQPTAASADHRTFSAARRMPVDVRSTVARRARSRARRGGSPPLRPPPVATLSGRRRRPSRAAAGELW